MQRSEMIERVFDGDEPWDIAVIGGGATGMGIALDAASRGHNTVLVEQSDFGKATSSRSTKLAHGGVRYLQQGNISLVMEALKERGIMRQNAPHLVHDLAFIVPNYDWWEAPFYGVGMKVYDMLAGKFGFGKSRILSKEKVVEHIPTLETKGLRGGVLYYDGQFDDARLLIDLARTASQQGAALLNYCKAIRITHDGEGFINGLVVRDEESGREKELNARCVINATGAFTDEVTRMDDPDAKAMIAPSQGVHIVLDRSFLGGKTAIMVPRTSDGRVLFAIPWQNRALIGTTDTAIDSVSLEPRALEEEIDFLIETAQHYLEKNPTRDDILSVFTGIRPLVRAEGAGSTAALSRDHTVHISKAGLLTIAGGKWTTYRRMAEDAVNHAETLGKIDEQPCVTRMLNIHGYHKQSERFGDLAGYGSSAPAIQQLARAHPDLGKPLHEQLPVTGAQVIWACRFEMARTLDDVLSRRTRSLLLNARASIDIAPRVAELMAGECGFDADWQQREVRTYTDLAEGYLIPR